MAHIGNGAFQGCSSVASLTIPNSVTHIGNSAFGVASYVSSREEINATILVFLCLLILSQEQVTKPTWLSLCLELFGKLDHCPQWEWDHRECIGGSSVFPQIAGSYRGSYFSMDGFRIAEIGCRCRLANNNGPFAIGSSILQIKRYLKGHCFF